EHGLEAVLGRDRDDDVADGAEGAAVERLGHAQNDTSPAPADITRSWRRARRSCRSTRTPRLGVDALVSEKPPVEKQQRARPAGFVAVVLKPELERLPKCALKLGSTRADRPPCGPASPPLSGARAAGPWSGRCRSRSGTSAGSETPTGPGLRPAARRAESAGAFGRADRASGRPRARPACMGAG